MSEIVVRGHHDLGLARAKRLAETIALRLRDDYGVTYAWTGDQLQFERTGASGPITVEPDAFEVRVEIGFLLSPLRGRIEREIRVFCDEQFGKVGSPDRDQPARPAVRSAATRSSRSQGVSRSVRPK
jgi:putative polyhydroxyalkanoate system protein